MINNDKAKKAIIDWSRTPMYSKTETDFFDLCGHIGNFSRNEVITFYSGYAARDKEAEDEKRELIDALIENYTSYIVQKEIFEKANPQIWSVTKGCWLTTPDITKKLIEKHTGKPIDEVVK